MPAARARGVDEGAVAVVAVEDVRFAGEALRPHITSTPMNLQVDEAPRFGMVASLNAT